MSLEGWLASHLGISNIPFRVTNIQEWTWRITPYELSKHATEGQDYNNLHSDNVAEESLSHTARRRTGRSIISSSLNPMTENIRRGEEFIHISIITRNRVYISSR